MTNRFKQAVLLCTLATASLYTTAAIAESERISAVKLTPDQLGVGYVESMAEVLARDAELAEAQAMADGHDAKTTPKHGAWFVPGRRTTARTHSGQHNLVNKYGDTRMGITFPDLVDLKGAYFSGQENQAIWAKGIRIHGYRSGVEVVKTTWFTEITADPTWFAMKFEAVDRIVIEAKPAMNGAGFYAIDDLTFSPHRPVTAQQKPGAIEPVPTVVTFDDVLFNTKLTGTGYAGLTWETGTGDFTAQDNLPAPAVPPGYVADDPPGHADAPENPENAQDGSATTASGGAGTPPILTLNYEGIRRGESGSSSNPPDTCGAIGPDHYVEAVNRVFAVYDKESGDQLMSVNLGTFLPGSSGDPRVFFDQHSDRWFVLASNFSNRIYYAVSLTSNPMGNWFKANFSTAQWGWPDFPTFGVDANGIYIETYTVGNGNMAIFALDKAPLIASPPSVGAVSVFPNLPWEGAMQPCHTYGETPGEYIISRRTSTSLRIRRVDPPMTNPTLVTVGNVTIPSHNSPPDAAALGSNVPLDTVGHRIVNAVYRDGSIWCAHTIGIGARAACRWYEIDPVTRSLIQSGTISAPQMHYFYPTLTVNRFGGVAMGFSGSSSSTFAACFYSGRLAGDPPGQMADPVMLKEGLGAINNLDGFGRNRWGDYSSTTLDPIDEHAIWTVQELARTGNNWGTWVARLITQDDCNGNDLADACEIDCNAFDGDCNVSGCGVAFDCNNNIFPDQCDIASSSSLDLNQDAIPDECTIPGDTDNDVDIDLTDFAVYFECDNATEGGVPPGCEVFDFNRDNEINLTDFAQFQVRYTGDCGVVVTQSPEGKTTCLGGSITLSADATADELSFAWYLNGQPVPDASTADLEINPITEEDIGTYIAYALSGCGVAATQSATLQVHPSATIVVEPVDLSMCPGNSAQFTVIVAGIPPFSYQWRKDGVDIEGETENSFTIDTTTPADGGAYECIISDGCNQPTPTQSATLQILPTVNFITSPESGNFCVGDLMFLSADATGIPEYQWFKDGQPIPDATELFYFIPAVAESDAGTYFVRGENQCDDSVSDIATITVEVCP